MIDIRNLNQRNLEGKRDYQWYSYGFFNIYDLQSKTLKQIDLSYILQQNQEQEEYLENVSYYGIAKLSSGEILFNSVIQIDACFYLKFMKTANQNLLSYSQIIIQLEIGNKFTLIPCVSRGAEWPRCYSFVNQLVRIKK
ncbi:hypothetical protein TTHERM_01087960 (macronuclear) [Tetrahymena thermophila SB210]|uniref:Uncharacterized protein n=1 Tax=Tetrahymena thermophila (strain SB210) TaxID=312017 RepID=Q23M70_TETTS|nr:hypothetical protein TTHERM_01087960 [Tetrahymena thermophila SB210]EAR97643.1 hypothetical protein TTHERM_01087960 [Tetrahymena thermophila SB210]|eukprot:XP_001017888.1 hypothetical protein TTHERM_01087960 [Tetrahymena thermophila SB210]